MLQGRQKRGGWGGPRGPTFRAKFGIIARVNSLYLRWLRRARGRESVQCTCSKHEQGVTFGQLDCCEFSSTSVFLSDVFVSTASTCDWWQGAPALLLPLSAAWFWEDVSGEAIVSAAVATVDRARDRWLQIVWKRRFLVFKVQYESATRAHLDNWKWRWKNLSAGPLCRCLPQRHRSELSAAPTLGSFRRPCVEFRCTCYRSEMHRSLQLCSHLWIINILYHKLSILGTSQLVEVGMSKACSWHNSWIINIIKIHFLERMACVQDELFNYISFILGWWP